MAIKIQETPILEGKDAKTFLTNLINTIGNTPNEAEKKIKAAELERMRANYEQLQAITKCVY